MFETGGATSGGGANGGASQVHGGALSGGASQLNGGALSGGGTTAGSLQGGATSGGSTSGGGAGGGALSGGAAGAGALTGGTADGGSLEGGALNGGEPSFGGEDSGGAGGESGTAVEYSACYYAGGVDHVSISKYDPATNLCVTMMFVSPGTNNTPGLELPPRYSFQAASATYPADHRCHAQGSSDPVVFSHSATGVADWRMGSGLPLVGVSIDAYVLFDDPIPSPQHLQASSIGSVFCQ